MFFSLSAESQGHFLKGIIYNLVNILKISDPIASRYVIPTASSTLVGNVETLVLCNSNSFQTSFTLDKPWIQLEFSKRYIFPNAYSMRGVNNNNVVKK